MAVGAGDVVGALGATAAAGAAATVGTVSAIGAPDASGCRNERRAKISRSCFGCSVNVVYARFEKEIQEFSDNCLNNLRKVKKHNRMLVIYTNSDFLAQ